jgi:hypothetical protein
MSRTYDIGWLDTPQFGAGEVRMGIGVPDAPFVVTGLAKLSQRYAAALLEDSGDPERRYFTGGTRLVENVRIGVSGNRGMIMQAWVLANAAAVDALRTEVVDAETVTPPEELLEEAELVSLDVDLDKVAFRVRLHNAAGDAAVFHVPVTVEL